MSANRTVSCRFDVTLRVRIERIENGKKGENVVMLFLTVQPRETKKRRVNSGSSWYAYKIPSLKYATSSIVRDIGRFETSTVSSKRPREIGTYGSRLHR